MPSSALNRLTRLGIETPWLFELSSTGVSDTDFRVTHAGVLEFIAEEGQVHLPAWVSVAAAERLGRRGRR